MSFRVGDLVKSKDTGRIGKVTGIMPSGRLDIYMVGAGSFIPYSKPELWYLSERPETPSPEDPILNGGQVIMDTDLIRVIQRQAETIGFQRAALAQIQWMSRNYIVLNIRATDHELRRVLRDIDQTTITVTTGGELSFTLKGAYEDARHNPFPPASPDTDSNTTQEG